MARMPEQRYHRVLAGAGVVVIFVLLTARLVYGHGRIPLPIVLGCSAAGLVIMGLFFLSAHKISAAQRQRDDLDH